MSTVDKVVDNPVVSDIASAIPLVGTVFTAAKTGLDLANVGCNVVTSLPGADGDAGPSSTGEEAPAVVSSPVMKPVTAEASPFALHEAASRAAATPKAVEPSRLWEVYGNTTHHMRSV